MSTQTANLKSQISRAIRAYGDKYRAKKNGKKPKVPKKSTKPKKTPKFLNRGKEICKQTTHGSYFNQNALISYDQKKMAHMDVKTYTLHIIFKTGKKISVKGVYSQEFFFDPDGRRIAYVTLPVAGRLLGSMQSIWTIDVASGRKKKIYQTDKDYGSLRGLEWAPDGIHLYTIELLESKEAIRVHRILRINANSGKVDIVRQMKTNRSYYCFFNPPTTIYEYTGKSSNVEYQFLYGTPYGIYLSSPDGKDKKKILNYSGEGCDNTEWAPDLTQIALNFDGLQRSRDKGKTAKGVYIYRVAEGKVYHIYKERGIYTMWWSPNSKFLAFSNSRTLWVYTYDPGDDQREANYRCIAQFWLPPSPPDLTMKVKANILKKENKIRFEITVINRGEGKSKKTTLSLYRDKEKIFMAPIPPLEGGQKYVFKGKNGQECLETALPGKKEVFEKFWLAVGMEQKIEEVTYKNNFVAIPIPPKKKTYTSTAVIPKVFTLSEVGPQGRITGFYWSKNSENLLISAGRWLYGMVKHNKKVLVLPLLQAPKGAFFARPKFYGNKIVATSYSFAPPVRPKGRGRKKRRRK